jgi:ketosteroid isomerase-like protein
MRNGILVLALLGLVQGCGGAEADGPPSSETGESSSAEIQSRNLGGPITPYPGIEQIEFWKFDLMKTDRAFAFAIRYEGFDAWASFFALNGSTISVGVGEIKGPEAILASLLEATASQALTGLTWTPERAEVSNGGNLGYTVGDYRSSGLDAEGVHTVVSGKYVSIWRRGEDGSWKVEMNLGTPTTVPEVTPAPGTEGGAGDPPS